MRFGRSLFLACVATAMLATGVAAQTQTGSETEAAPEGSLYQRMGGYDTIAAVVDDFFERLGSNERTQRFFVGFSDSSMRRIRQLTVDFICEKSGGPCFYTGRSMVESHKGSGITAADWDQAGVLMGETLDKFGVQGELREEIGGFISGLRDDIVEGD